MDDSSSPGNTASKSKTRRDPLKPKPQSMDEARKLVTHPKKRRPSKRSMNAHDMLQELLKTPGEKAREEILSITLSMHEMNPSTDGDQRIESMLANFDLEREIESKDPVSFDDAISRVRQDVESLFIDRDVDDIWQQFFSPYHNGDVQGRISPEELEAQWMSRWITPLEGRKRTIDEWCKLVGFAGEYLVLIVRLTVLMNRSFAFFRLLCQNLRKNDGQAR